MRMSHQLLLKISGGFAYKMLLFYHALAAVFVSLFVKHSDKEKGGEKGESQTKEKQG
jgi:hypothetical protein